MKLQHIVPNQLPEFVSTEYPAFVDFLKAYYKWFEEVYSLGKLEDLLDLDLTIDAFLQYFKSQLDVYGVLASSNDRSLLRHIKDLYTSKGSDESFNFFFKAVYDKESSVFHPWDITFKPSEGKWQQDTATSVRVIRGNATSLPGNTVFIVDSNGVKYKTDVRAAIPRAGTELYELIISRFSCGPVRFVRVESLNGDFEGTIVDTTIRARVEKAGSGFEAGQIFRITSYGGSGTTIKVKSVTPTGGILAVEIISFGTGYTSDFNVQISPSNALKPADLKNKIRINNLQYDAGDAIDLQRQTGVVVKHDYSNLTQKYMDTTYVGSIVGEFQSQDGVVYYGTDYAQIKFTVGCVYRYPGYYVSSENVLGDLAYIQDSFYYQVYSYETAVEQNVKRYGDLLRATLHPAGTEHFSKYLIANQFTIVPRGELSLNVIQKPGGSIRDLFNLQDQQIKFDVSKSLEDDLTLQDAGGIYTDDDDLLYVEIIPKQFWLAGYLDGEVPFSN